MRRRIPLAPAEGWLTLGCVILICLTMAWTIDDARWVLGQPTFLDYLVVAAIGGALAGFIGPKVGWGRWLTYLIGSIFAALIVPILTGIAAHRQGASIHDLYQATADSVVRAYIDLAILNLSTTAQYLHYIFTIGILVWATSMFASYAVFGHRRPLGGVVIIGLILVLNMSLTTNDELPFLVLFSLASLFLLIRSHVFDEQTEWVRRRIGDPASISSVYLRGGTVFIAVAVVASFLLTQTAASAPLAGAWDGVQDGLIGISQSLQRFLPTGGSNRAISLSFGPNAPVGQLWTTDGGLAVTIQRDPTDDGRYYWRAVTYDRIDLKGWSQSASATVVIPAGKPLTDNIADGVDPQGRHSFKFTVTPAGFRGPTILSPATPIQVTESARLTTVGTDGYFATVERDGGSGSYTVTALTPVDGNGSGELNTTALRATDTNYPQEIKDLYLPKLPDGMLGPAALKLEEKIVAEAPSMAPIDLADQLVTELQSKNYTYTVDMTGLDCANLSTVECFAANRTGFCQYYAATMAVILRDLGVPTRIAEGFLPGTRAPHTATEQVLFSSAHAWVEVYFTGYGWVTFDPTGGNLSQVAPLPSGPPIASTGPRSSFALPPPASRKPDLEAPGVTGSKGGPTNLSGRTLGPLVAVGALLLLIVSALAFLAWQRGPRGPTSADGAYGSVTRIASRLGFGPRPAQTVYEYASTLGDVLPTVRPELQIVARAKVESVYAREILGQERLDSLRAAQRRLRVSLLRLAFRRKERRRR
jgi:transglutaminase-like putative cysteine protease